MTTALRLALGAPGVAWLPPEPVRALTNERMDVAAFVGVAPRGPAHVAVPVESWDEYARRYGRFEGPGLLPYAVASFFENGGARAYVVRVTHETAAAARAPLPGVLARSSAGDTTIWLGARNAGAWGSHLRATLSYTTRPLVVDVAGFSAAELVGPSGMPLVAGTLLRLLRDDGGRAFVRIAAVRETWHATRAVRELHATFDAPIALPVAAAEIVEGVLDVDDGDGRSERHESLGTSPQHPRWLARVLAVESSLLVPAADPTLPESDSRRTWVDRDLAIDLALAPSTTDAFAEGDDRYRDIVPDDCFDAAWVLGDDEPGRGIHALVALDDLSLVALPDLYSPKPLVPRDEVTDAGGAGAAFCECVETPPVVPHEPADDLDGLRLDPALDLATIIGLQQRVIALADTLESWVALLDAPPGLSQRQLLRWRGALDSMYAAAYHPWLRVARSDDARDAAIDVPPSAVAAGVTALRALTVGVQYGPANVIAAGVFDVVERVSPARHDALHPVGLNVFLLERDGVRLTAARTLSSDRRWRQLSVRRLMTMVRRVLLRQMQWTAFEPNGAPLRSSVMHLLEAYLRQLYVANAFAGSRPEEAFFVRCDGTLNPPASLDLGRLVTHVGVAPAEPLEFLVVQLAREGDGTLRAQG